MWRDFFRRVSCGRPSTGRVWCVLFLGLAFSVVGCAGVDLLGLAFKDGPRLVACGVSDYNRVMAGLAVGNAGDKAGEAIDFVGAIAESLQCVDEVAGDIEAAAKRPAAIAQALLESAGLDASSSDEALIVPRLADAASGVPPARMVIVNPSKETLRRAHVAVTICRAAKVCK